MDALDESHEPEQHLSGTDYVNHAQYAATRSLLLDEFSPRRSEMSARTLRLCGRYQRICKRRAERAMREQLRPTLPRQKVPRGAL